MSTFLFVVGGQVVWSHAFVLEESPAPNSYLETPPTAIKITFNSKVEKNLFTIQLYDEQQIEVSTYSAEISENQKEIRLQLPSLEGGLYQVRYYVISSNDGHRVEGFFRFHVAKSDDSREPLPNKGISNEDQHIEPPISQEPVIATTSPYLAELIMHVMRSIHYFGLLFLLGWIFFWRMVQAYAPDVKKKYLSWGFMIQLLHLVGLSAIILIQLNVFNSSGLFFTPNFPFQSNFGLFWIVSLIMALLGLIYLFDTLSN